MAHALAWAGRRFACLGENARLDAEVLLAGLLAVERSYLLTWPERRLPPALLTRYRAQVTRRASGYPVAYLTGVREFWSLDLRVTPATLIPRPETEGLVEVALTSLAGITHPAALDLGTGSGAIALAIATERSDATVVAVDTCPEALAVARCNARRLGLLQRIRFLLGDWLEPVGDRRFHLIVANPPYIAPTEAEIGCTNLRFEPLTALLAPEQGLAELRRIVSGATANLHHGGVLAVEHGYRQGAAVRALFQTAGFKEIRTETDLQGHPRLTVGFRPNEDPA
ncbi:MAG: peptide chain release factor N(5)-glutamine methyltransferase [Nitrococcus mobilis]|nr:peptide chain release factor N(5)-glutamine methyltransferase [Nitrococcus mobilis]